MSFGCDKRWEMTINCVLSWVVGLIVNGHDRHWLRGSSSCSELLHSTESLLERKCLVELTWTEEGAMRLEFHANCPPVTVESWHFSVSATDEEIMGAFEPSGFGRVVSTPFAATFPSMQFTGLFIADRRGCVYFGIHDGQAFPKKISFDLKSVQADLMASSEIDVFTSLPLKIMIITGECSWRDLADIYKHFAVDTEWYRAGKSRRGAASHLLRYPLWVNTHWQSVDVLERMGGDPNTVLQRISRLKAVFPDIPLLLHWYEWDLLGYIDSDYEVCDEDVCGFDSHYPQYFPERTNFSEIVSLLHASNVGIVPYLNGRIFDQQLPSWKTNSLAQSAAAKGRSGQFYSENYGNGVYFAVMCPATDFWSETLSSTVLNLLNNTPDLLGVYMDQLGAADPVLCHDKNHSHVRGGGSSWTSGHRDILRRINNSLSDAQIIMTESNVEQLIGSVDAFLALTAYQGNLSQIVPAFQYVYPGMFATGGAIFYTQDLTEDEGVAFLQKIMKQFMLGSHLGWFSLGGNNMQLPSMAMLDALSSPNNRHIVDSLRHLLKARSDPTVQDYFYRGALVLDIGTDGYVWAREEKTLIITCNSSLKPHVVEIKVDLSPYFTSSVVDILVHSPDGWKVQIRRVTTDVTIDGSIDGRRCLIYEVVESEDPDDTLELVITTYYSSCDAFVQ